MQEGGVAFTVHGRSDGVQAMSLRRPWRLSAACAFGTIALHALLISVCSLGTVGGMTRAHRGGEMSAAQLPMSKQGFITTIIFLDPTVLSSEEGISASRSALKALAPKDLITAHLVRLSAPKFHVSDGGRNSRQDRGATSTTAVDGLVQARLFGRYVDLISARIERAWIRPKTPPAGMILGEQDQGIGGPGGLFKCRAQILQSPEGKVLEVQLLECDSSPEWEESLVNAINAASPLPSPPAESVFARSLVLNFTSAPRSSKSATQTAKPGP